MDENKDNDQAVSILLRDFNYLIDKWQENRDNSNQELLKYTGQLEGIISTLAELQRKQDISLSLAPQIVEKLEPKIHLIYKDVLDRFNENIGICQKNLDILARNSQEQIEKISSIASSALQQIANEARFLRSSKKTIVAVVLTIIISGISSATSIYYVITHHPKKLSTIRAINTNPVITRGKKSTISP